MRKINNFGSVSLVTILRRKISFLVSPRFPGANFPEQIQKVRNKYKKFGTNTNFPEQISEKWRCLLLMSLINFQSRQSITSIVGQCLGETRSHPFQIPPHELIIFGEHSWSLGERAGAASKAHKLTRYEWGVHSSSSWTKTKPCSRELSLINYLEPESKSDCWGLQSEKFVQCS